MSYVKGDFKDIQDFLRGLGIRKRIYETSMALKCTLAGLKTSFLWDTSLPPSPTALLGLQSCCETAQVLILLIEGDTVVTTRENLQNLLIDLKEALPVFVGFGVMEGRPILVDLALEEKEKVFGEVEKIIVSKENVTEVEVEGLNLPCLVGILLGFPVVYNFPDQVGNSLGNLDLVVLKMEVSWGLDNPVTPVSFSIPLHLKAEEKVVQRLNLWWSKLSGGLAWAQPFTAGELAIALSQEVQNLPTVML